MHKDSTQFEDKAQTLHNVYNELVSLGVVGSWKDFAALIGVNRSNLSAAKNGDGRMLTDNLIKKSIAALNEARNTNGSIFISQSPHAIGVSGNGNRIGAAAVPQAHALVPTIPYKIYQEAGVNLMEYCNSNPVHRGPAVAQFAQTDLHMFVHNDEMKPHLRAGDVLSLKMLPEGAPIINGEMYVVNTTNVGILIRYVFDRGEHLELKSSNEWFEDFQISKRDVFAIFRILGLVRTNI